MRIESSFHVPAQPAQAWDLLLDVPRVIPCMPGATLEEEVDDSNWKTKMAVKLGPISLTFATDVSREVADEEAGRVVLAANAREIRGRGSARATIESTLVPEDEGTTIGVVTDLTLSGSVAQYGRGIVQDVTEQLLARFADCLRLQLQEPVAATAEAAAGPPAPTAPAAAAPISGGRLVLRALLHSITRLFRRG